MQFNMIKYLVTKTKKLKTKLLLLIWTFYLLWKDSRLQNEESAL